MSERTHWEDCWRDRAHHECAVGRIAALERQLADSQAQLAERTRERDEWKREADIATHKCIACGVAATHPDAALTTRGAYADKWDSPQAQSVRELRARAYRAEADAGRQLAEALAANEALSADLVRMIRAAESVGQDLAERTREREEARALLKSSEHLLFQQPRELLARAESAESEVRALRSALERAVDCINGLLARTPVRDVAETLAECAAALNERGGT